MADRASCFEISKTCCQRVADPRLQATTSKQVQVHGQCSKYPLPSRSKCMAGTSSIHYQGSPSAWPALQVSTTKEIQVHGQYSIYPLPRKSKCVANTPNIHYQASPSVWPILQVSITKQVQVHGQHSNYPLPSTWPSAWPALQLSTTKYVAKCMASTTRIQYYARPRSKHIKDSKERVFITT